MQHLAVLEDAGLVIVKRKGRYRWNYLDAIPIKRIHDRWIGPYAASAVNRLDKLKLDVEADEDRSTGKCAQASATEKATEAAPSPSGRRLG